MFTALIYYMPDSQLFSMHYLIFLICLRIEKHYCPILQVKNRAERLSNMSKVNLKLVNQAAGIKFQAIQHQSILLKQKFILMAHISTS